MAKKANFDKELVRDTRTEHRKQAQSAQPVNPATPPPSPEPQTTPPPDPEATNHTATPPPIPPPQPDTASEEFRKRCEEFFKGAGSVIGGTVAVDMVDDIKANLLYILAKKQGVELEKNAFKLDPKARDLAAFAVDHALRGKLFEWLEKNPLAVALGVVGISAGSGYLTIQMLKGFQDSAKKAEQEKNAMQAEIDRLKRERQRENREAATDAEIETETSHADEVENAVGKFAQTL